MDRFKNFVRVSAVIGIQSALGKAEVLGEGQTFFGDPLYYVKATEASLAVTPNDVERVIKEYLTPGRIVVSMVPSGKLDLISKPSLPYTNVTPAPEAAPAKAEK